jgi:RNA polymerase sigma factor (sigma-70 family)
MDDWDLIQAYRGGSTEASEKAFAEIVRRHVNLVYSAAYRSLGGNRSLAEDVTQRTFTLLAARAARFDQRVALVSWLYKTACNLSREALRGENRRRTRELEGMQMQTAIRDGTSGDSSAAKWEEIAPHLEEAMSALPEKERVLILLRFFERKPFSAVAEALHISEEAARMRATRALQKLRGFFAKRGITISSIAIGNLLLESAVSAAPAALVASLAVPAKLATIAVPLTLATKWLLMTTAQKTAVVAMALLLAVGIGIATALRNGERTSAALRFEQSVERAGSNALDLAKTRAASGGAASSAAAKARLDRAIANLRSALTEEWPDRRMPMARLRLAVEDFGANREAAVPILLEYLNGQRSARSLTAMSGAAYCLEFLGTDAASALPDLFILLRSGDLAIWNDFIPRVFTALSPDGAIIPELLDSLTSVPPGGSQVVATLTKLFEMNPALVETHHAIISSLLDDRRYSLSAALLLARAPGIKDRGAIPVLTNALQVARPRPAVKSDFVDERGQPIYFGEPELFQDDVSRLAAVQALGEMGSAATNALPALIDFAKTASTNPPFYLRELALATIGKIDPMARKESPEIEAATHAQERSAFIIEKARDGTASFEELAEGLKLRNAADSAAEALANHPEARAAIPQLIAAVDQFESSSAVDLLKKLDHGLLIDRIKAGNTRALNEVARALGEIGPDAKDALPQLIELLDVSRPADADSGRPYALDEAIHKIDSAQPKLLYRHEDLADASAALGNAIYSQNKTRSPVYGGKIRDFQDINAVSRGHLLRFVETTKADPDLHRIFVDALLRKNPELSREITQQLSHSR